MKRKSHFLFLICIGVFAANHLPAQNITLVDRITGTNDPSKLTTILDWAGLSNCSFTLQSVNTVTNTVSTTQTVSGGLNFQFKTAQQPVIPSGSFNVTEQKYSTGVPAGFGTTTWNPAPPGSSTVNFSYDIVLTTTAAPGKCQFTITDMDGRDHFRIFGKANGGAIIVPQAALRATSGSNITATTSAGSYLDLKSNATPTSDYDIKGSVDVYFTTAVNEIVIRLMNDAATPLSGSTCITNVMGAACTTPADIPSSQMSVISFDSQESSTYAATNAIDGNMNTMWHTKWSNGSAPYPHEIQIDLGATYSVSSLKYLPRQDGNPNGRISQYEIYVSASTGSWGTAVATGTFANSAAEKVVTFAAKSGRYIRLKALSEVNGNPWASAAEIKVSGCTSSSGVEEQFFTSSNTVTAAMKTYFNQVYNNQLGIGGADYDGPDEVATTIDNSHVAQSTLKKTLVGQGRHSSDSWDVGHPESNGDIYVSVEPSPAFNSILTAGYNPYGHEYPLFPNWFPNLNLEVSVDTAARRFITERFFEPDRQIGAYGVWIKDENHWHSPEIHTVDQLWTRFDSSNGRSLIRLAHTSDGSNRFDSQQGNWIPKPNTMPFAIAFKMLPGASEETYTVTRKLAKKVNVIADDSSHRMYFNGAPLITVNESGFNDLDVQFENVYLDTDGYVKGFIVIKSSINQTANVGDAYLFYEIDKGGFVKGTPAVPSSFSVTSITDHTAKFNWSGSDGNTIFYPQVRIPGRKDWGSVESYSTKGNYKYIYGFNPNTTYEWRVVSYNRGNENVSTVTGTFKTGTQAKPVPTGLSVNNITSNSMQLNWTAPSGATGYHIEYGRSTDPWIHADPDTITGNSYVLTNLLPGTSYTWRVFAMFADGGYSSPVAHGYTSTSGTGMARSAPGESVSSSDKPKTNDFLQHMDTTNSAGFVQLIEMAKSQNQQVVAHTERDLRYFPNPVTSELEIVIDRGYSFSELKLEVYDVAGRLMLQKKYNNFKKDYGIDCSSLTSGFYFLKVTFDNKTSMVDKFVKQ